MLISVGWLPPFIDSSRKLPRSRVADRVMLAVLTVPRILPVVAAIASSDRSHLASSFCLWLSCGVGNGPNEARQFARHCHADLVDLHVARTQLRKASGQP